MLLNDWFWSTLPDESWTVTDDGQRIITDTALRAWLSGFDRLALVESDGDNVTPETTGEAGERPDESGRDDKILEVLAGLAEQVAQLRNTIDGKADDNVDGEDVEQW